MLSVQSKDSTRIAYDQEGSGPALILIAGAMCGRLSWFGPKLSQLLAPHFTVYNYDRRGRGDSGDAQPYAVDREIEDLECLIDTAGGSAFVWGHSAGAALAIEATAALGRKVAKLAFYDVPYATTDEETPAWHDYLTHLKEKLAHGEPGEAAALFLRFNGMPAEKIENVRQSANWTRLVSLAPTLAYDHLGVLRNDRHVPPDFLAKIVSPTLIMAGGNSPPFMPQTAKVLKDLMPQATLRLVDGQAHNPDVAVLAPILREFFLGR